VEGTALLDGLDLPSGWACQMVCVRGGSGMPASMPA
jgi:hypothetical protein